MKSIDMPESDTAFGGIFASTSFINDSLPHYLYARMADSVERKLQKLKFENESYPSFSQSFGSFGIATFERPEERKKQDLAFMRLLDTLNKIPTKQNAVKYQDSLKKLQIQSEKATQKLYFIALKEYNLDEDSRFFIQDGNYNLAYVQWDRIQKTENGSNRWGHYERKRIPVRYSAKNKTVFIPITKGQYSVISVVLYICSFASLFFFAYVIIGLPVQVLINIAKGKAFTRKNVHNLKLIAYFIAGFILLTITIHYLLHYFLRSRIPTDFQINSSATSVSSLLPWIIAVIALYIIAKAFERGCNLQEEQNLTI
jgi:hypothetical protein